MIWVTRKCSGLQSPQPQPLLRQESPQSTTKQLRSGVSTALLQWPAGLNTLGSSPAESGEPTRMHKAALACKGSQDQASSVIQMLCGVIHTTKCQEITLWNLFKLSVTSWADASVPGHWGLCFTVAGSCAPGTWLWQQQPLCAPGGKYGFSFPFPPLKFILIFCSDLRHYYINAAPLPVGDVFKCFDSLLLFSFCMLSSAARSLLQRQGIWEGPSVTCTQPSLQQQVTWETVFCWTLEEGIS